MALKNPIENLVPKVPKPGSSAANRERIETYEQLSACPDGRLVSLNELAKILGRSTRSVSLMLRRLEKKSGSPLLLDIGSVKPRFAVTAGSLKKMLSVAYQVRPGEVEELRARVTQLAELLDKAVEAINFANQQLVDQQEFVRTLASRVTDCEDAVDANYEAIRAIPGSENSLS